MTAPHRFLANDRNAAAATGATVAASSILPAEATAFPLARTRQGTARAIVTGGYTGPADAALDIEIVSASGTGLLSAPTFAGAGNGALTDLAATGVPSQTFSVLLASTGTRTEAAALPFYGVVLQAKATGAAGNGIAIEIDAAGLAAAASVLSLLEAVSAGDSDFSGPEWDFGSYPLTASGDLDARTPRIRFGHDPQIYRQYKELIDGEWHYVVDPPIVRDLPAGTVVYAVTGSYAATVTQGATVENYAGIVTLFDFLNALKTRSNLIEVVGVVVEDKTPGGMAAEDLPARTDACALQPRFAGNAAFPGLGPVTVPDDAPTQLVTLTCKDTSALGGELWSVRGGVTGALADCVTARPYSSGGYGWTVPAIDPPEVEAPTGKIYVKSIDLVSRGEGEEGVEVCVRPLIAGAKAKAKTVTVTYTAKPPPDCPCDSAPVSGRLSETCLGVKIEGGTDMGTLPAWYRARLEALSAWHKGFVAANAAITAQGEARAAEHDIRLADLARDAALSCLDDLNAGGTMQETAWAAAAAVAKDEAREPTARNGYRYRATVGGITGASQPTWPITLGNTVVDGTVTWKCVSKTPDLAWDDVLAAADSDLTPLKALGAEAASAILVATANTAYTAGDVRKFEYGWYDTGLVWHFSSYAYYRCTANGTTAASTPISMYMNKVDFGTSAWEAITPQEASVIAGGDNADINAIAAVATDPGISRDPATFAAKYAAAFDEVRALAGVYPKNEAGSGGSDCWQPCDGDFEWRVNGLEYLPACTNKPYHSCVLTTDADGVETVVSTQEFGFVIRVGCPDKLKEGDAFTIVIESDASPVKTYEVGDTITVPVVAGQPLELAGGVDGDDTLTWTVRGSLGAAWPDYAAETGAEPLYDESGLQFRIASGGIPFALGDRFDFAVAGGTFRWRMDAGAWSGNIAIGAAATSLQDGLSVLLAPGPAPAFVAGDAWAFAVKQPHAPAMALTPARGAWRWAGAGATWTATFAADQPVAAVALWHDCPAGASFSVQGLSAADAVLWTKTVSYRAGLTVAIFEGADAVADCRKVRLTVAGATGGSVKWFWCGRPLSTAHGAAITWRRAYAQIRGAYFGAGRGGEIRWENWLLQSELDEILALIDAAKRGGDLPFVLVPNALHPAEAMLARAEADALDVTDVFDFQPSDSARRRLSLTLPLAAVPL